MAGFRFNCPHCKQSLEAPEEILGQQINCPSCNRAITLPDPQPTAPTASPPPPQNQTKACSFCGEAILLAAVKCKHCGEFLDGRNRQAAAAPPPPQPKKSKLQVENDLWKGNPSYLYYLGHFIFGVILLPLFGLGLLFIVYALLDRNFKVYTLTNKRVMSKAGIISRKIHEIGVRDIRNINVKQSILERLFGLGTIEIASAGTGGIEVSFAGINNPMRARDLIRREKDEADNRD
ncbi:MAG: PH domain-containing protein [Syntrophales bacterium]|jgi:membrane protein YdbS with pleckstrin-like domain|nr:PH domain-containing protein [Syntrophales bacterium]MCK9527954.1 PH domain-containing protein [Syntrophales bacterium]MDX9921871.1 PH domain-containing protein [Syntrophales bacterium]